MAMFQGLSTMLLAVDVNICESSDLTILFVIHGWFLPKANNDVSGCRELEMFMFETNNWERST